MMTCYLNVDPDDYVEAGQKYKEGFSEELGGLLFSQRPDKKQQVMHASKAQWTLLESVVVEIQKDRESRQQQQKGPNPGQNSAPINTNAPPVAAMSTANQYLYMLVAFGVMFGLGAIVVMKL